MQVQLSDHDYWTTKHDGWRGMFAEYGEYISRCLDQSEVSIQVTWSILTNQRPVFLAMIMTRLTLSAECLLGQAEWWWWDEGCGYNQSSLWLVHTDHVTWILACDWWTHSGSPSLTNTTCPTPTAVVSTTTADWCCCLHYKSVFGSVRIIQYKDHV